MYVCLCLGVTDHDLRETIADGATSPEEVMYCTGAGTCCGTCRATVAAIVEDALEASEPLDLGPSRARCRLRVLQQTTAA